jgi:hypothetical protein
LVLATPNGSAGTAVLRALVAADIPALPYDAAGLSAAETARAEAAEALLAPKASPTFTGNVTAPDVILTGTAPTVGAGQIGMGAVTSTSATSGTLTPPAKYAGYMIVNIGGTNFKLGYYPV